jgi:hypothetical protein
MMMQRVRHTPIHKTWTNKAADDERVFLIDEGLEFRFGSLDGDATCAWKDLSGDEGDLWEFVSSRVSDSWQAGD